MARIPFITAVLFSLSATAAGAQEPCPRPVSSYTLESAKEHLVELVEGEDADPHTAAGGPRVSGFVSTLLPAGDSCSRLEEGEDRQVVLEELIRFSADQSAGLHRGVMRATSVILQLSRDKYGLDVPVEALTYALEEGATEVTRDITLASLLRRVDIPEIHDLLLDRARAPRGPPRFPDLPEVIVERAYFSLGAESPFRAALEEHPDQIKNPRARCLVEERGARHRAPGPPPCP